MRIRVNLIIMQGLFIVFLTKFLSKCPNSTKPLLPWKISGCAPVFLFYIHTGLGDVTIESGVIAVGSVRKILDGKAYKRAIWFRKLMYETCLRFMPKRFFEWLIKGKPTEVILNAFGVSIEVIC